MPNKILLFILHLKVKYIKKITKYLFKFRVLKPAALCMYLTVLVDGFVFGVFDGFYAFFLVDELQISQKWIGIHFSYFNLFV